MYSKSVVYSTVFSMAAIALFLFFKRRKRVQRVGQIKKLYIYPVKSLPGIEVSTLEVTKCGVKYNQWFDRGFVIVSDKNVTVTARQIPSLLLLKLSFNGDELWIESPTQEPLKIKYMDKLDNDSKVIETSYLSMENMKGVDCGDEAASWIQAYIHREGYRLVQYVSGLPFRPSLEWTGVTEEFNSDEPILFHDGNPIHIINDGSVTDLNKKLPLENKVSYMNFRPNILLDCEAYSEDSWTELKINDTLLKSQKKVERCIMTTIDPETADRSTEPMKTLKEYRRDKTKNEQKYYGNKPFFGVTFAVKKEGSISNEDVVFAMLD